MITPLHVSFLAGRFAISAILIVSLACSVTVDKICSTASFSWFSWHSISNFTSPTVIFTRIGAFVSLFSCFVTLVPYCLLNCAKCTCATFKYTTTILAILVNLLIEQLPIATTPKYNFSLQTSQLQLPQKLLKLSMESLKTIKGESLQPNSQILHLQDTRIHQFEDSAPPTFNYSPTVGTITLKPVKTKTTVIAIDVSSIKIGETSTGILTAARGAIVWKKNRRYHYLRLGPLLFHLTPLARHQIHRFLHQKTSNLSSLSNLQIKIAHNFEQRIQMSISSHVYNSLILLDGSLTAGTSDTPTATLVQMLKTARKNFNTILAFSKVTSLRLWGLRLTELARKYTSPCLLKIENYSNSAGPMRLLGDLYIAKFTNGSCAFRLDIDKDIPKLEAVQAVEELLGNDLVPQSYPETLRLAHIYSTFTANEVIGIQRYLTQRCQLELVSRPNIRRLLFGPYGKGPEPQ